MTIASHSSTAHSPTDVNTAALTPKVVEEVERLNSRLAEARGVIGRVIFGQTKVIDETIITLLAGGHALLIGVPGLAKTRLVQTLGVVFGLDAKRVQFTPDLMPADILGSEVLEEAESAIRSFRFIKGPVFCQLLMADEINRASPRTQSALLQAMQEYKVSIAGHYHDLPPPFHVLATQNPLEQEGTYPLPEAQLDRFLMQIDVDYPDLEAERRMLLATTGAHEDKPMPVFAAEELMAAQRLVRRVPVGESVVAPSCRWCAPGRPDEESARCGAPACRLGSRTARRSGSDVGGARTGPDGRASDALDRRRRGACRTGPAAPHGPGFRRSRRGHHGGRSDRRLIATIA